MSGNELAVTALLMAGFGTSGVVLAVWNRRGPNRIKAYLAYALISAALMTPIWVYRALDNVGGQGSNLSASYFLTYVLFLIISRFAVEKLSGRSRRMTGDKQ